MGRLNKLLLVSGAVVSFITPVYASTTGSVGSPNVTAGKTEVIARFGYSEAEESSSQDERLRSRIHIDHGFTDFYAGRLIIAQDKRKNDSYEHDQVTFENRLHLLKSADHGFDFGVRGSYSHKDGDKTPSSVAFGLYELVPLNDYQLRANQIFDHDVGEGAGDGVSAELRLQVTRKLENSHRAGLESFHDFGNLTTLSGYSTQSHTFGPVFKGPLWGDLKYETGYRLGVSEAAPDHSIKFFVARSF